MKFFKMFGTKFTIGWKRAFFLSFVVGFAVRIVPEVLSFPYPIGFDQAFYVWRIKSCVVWHHWSNVFSTWLLYALLIPFCDGAFLDPLVLVKLTAALLFGFNACGIYYFSTKALGWTSEKGLLAGVFFSLQIAALAFSSNFYRNMLGLGILLFALPSMKDNFRNLRGLLAFTLLSVLVVFGHEHSFVILFCVFLGFLTHRFLKGKEMRPLRHWMAIFPALALFLISFYCYVFPVREITKNVIAVSEPAGNYEGILFFLKNYLAVYETAQYGLVYLDLVAQIFSLLAFLYIATLPLVVAGFFRDNILDSWTVMLLIGSFGALVMPFFALDLWWRWMLMLVYPFTFYAVNGITKILRSSRGAVGSTFRRVKWVRLILIIPFCLGLVFMDPVMQGTAVPLRDVDDTIEAMRWLDSEMEDDSALLVHVAFVFLTRAYLDDRYNRISFKDDIKGAMNLALDRGFNDIYFIWWTENNGRYGVTVPEDLISVFKSGRISAFKYCARSDATAA